MEQLLITYHNWAVSAGAFFFGESVIITAAYLAAELGWNIYYVVLAAFLGTVIADTAWFFFGKLVNKYFASSGYYQKKREQASVLLSALAGKRPFISLLYIKFLYGSRIAMIIYLAVRNVSFTSFTIFNSLGTLIWLAVIFPFGYFAGRTLAPQASSFFNAFGAAMTILILSSVLFKYTSKWLTKKIAQ